MLLFIFPTLLKAAEPTDFKKLERNHYKTSENFFDFQRCCTEFNCEKLANSLCDKELNIEICAWDAGDCGDCQSDCFWDMIGNGVCDGSCFNEECYFDGGDCDMRFLVGFEKDDEGLTLEINNQSTKISKKVETMVDSIIFDKIVNIEGEIYYNRTELKSINLVLNGEITLENFYFSSDPSSNLNISISHYGAVKLKNICFNQNISIEVHDSTKFSKKSIKELFSFESNNKDFNNCINFTYSLSEGYFHPIISGSKNNQFSLDEDSQTTTISNIDSNFNFTFSISHSNLTVKDSKLPSNESNLFIVTEGSFLSIINSTLTYNVSYLNVTSSNVLVQDSDLGDCKGGKVANLKNSTLTLQNIRFKQCIFDDMKNITKMTTCDSETCEHIQPEFKSCPNGQMDMIICTKCPDNYYRFENQDNLFCFKCPSTMNCTNGNVAPAKDIYQFEESKLQQIFRPCFRNESCKNPAIDSDDWTLNEQCKDGYDGKFCASCKKGYTSIGRYKCGKCPDKITNGFILVISIAVVSAMVIYLIKSTVISSFEPSEFYSIAIRIGINYFQVIYLCLQFRIAWPSANNDEKTAGDSAGTSIKESSNYYFSLQCLFEQFEDAKIYYYARVSFMTIFPIIVFTLSTFYLLILRFWGSKTFYMLLHRSRNLEKFKPSNLRIYTPVTFILPFLLIYPYVITYTLSPLACDSLENTKPQEYKENIDYSDYKYLMEVPDIWCTWSDHYRKIIWATGFSLVVWGFGVPIFIFYKLYQKRKNLFKYEVKYTFGFLISGYLHERFYWEFIIFIKKLLIVFLTVFMQTGYSITLQSILLITFLIAGFILQIYFKPYITDELNKLEIAGTLAAIITVLAAIIYTESNENSENLQLFLVFVMAVVNLSYIIYWLSFISKELFTYIISNIDFLKKRFLKRDGFDRDISKEYKNVEFVYIKEYQKLFTQAEFDEKAPENYLGSNPSYKSLIKKIISANLEEYESGRAPHFRAVERLPTLTRLNKK